MSLFTVYHNLKNKYLKIQNLQYLYGKFRPSKTPVFQAHNFGEEILNNKNFSSKKAGLINPAFNTVIKGNSKL